MFIYFHYCIIEKKQKKLLVPQKLHLAKISSIIQTLFTYLHLQYLGSAGSISMAVAI